MEGLSKLYFGYVLTICYSMLYNYSSRVDSPVPYSDTELELNWNRSTVSVHVFIPKVNIKFSVLIFEQQSK